MITGRPELGSVAPPARMPPKFWTAIQMRAKTDDGQYHRGLGDLRRHEHARGDDDADEGQQDRHGGAVVEEQRLRGSVDVGEPAGLSAVQSGNQVMERLRRPARTHEREDGQDPPRHDPDGLGHGDADRAGGHEGQVRSARRPQEHGQNGIEEHPARSTAERGGTSEEDAAQPLTEPPHPESPHDRERQRRLDGALVDDPEGDEELDPGEDGVGQDRLVVDVRGVPGDRVGDPARVSGAESVQHAAEAVRPAGEHERLQLQGGVQQPDGGQYQLEGPLEVPWWSIDPNVGGNGGGRRTGGRVLLHLGDRHTSPPHFRARSTTRRSISPITTMRSRSAQPTTSIVLEVFVDEASADSVDTGVGDGARDVGAGRDLPDQDPAVQADSSTSSCGA